MWREFDEILYNALFLVPIKYLDYFSSKGKISLPSRYLFSLFPFFLFLSERERERDLAYFSSEQTPRSNATFRGLRLSEQRARSRSGRPRQMRRRSHVKTEGTFLSPCWLPPRNDFVRLCAGLRGDIRRIRLIKSKDPSRSGEPRRVTKQLKRRINCDRTPGKISP